MVGLIPPAPVHSPARLHGGVHLSQKKSRVGDGGGLDVRLEKDESTREKEDGNAPQ